MPAKIKYKQVKVNFKPDDFAKLEELAKSKGITKAEYIRKKINMPLKKSKSVKNVNPKLIYELNKIGNNLNQISRYANTRKVLDKEILLALIRIEDKLKAIL